MRFCGAWSSVLISPNLNSLPIERLIAVYREAAKIHRAASREGDHEKANPAYERLAGLMREWRRRGEAEHTAFLELLNDPSLDVRGWAAAHALEFAPDQAEPILEEIESGPESLEEFSARMGAPGVARWSPSVPVAVRCLQRRPDCRCHFLMSALTHDLHVCRSKDVVDGDRIDLIRDHGVRLESDRSQ